MWTDYITVAVIAAAVVWLLGCSPVATRDLMNVSEHCANVCHGQVQSVVFTSPVTCICK